MPRVERDILASCLRVEKRTLNELKARDLISNSEEIVVRFNPPEDVILVAGKRQNGWRQRRLLQDSSQATAQHHRRADVREHEKRMPVGLREINKQNLSEGFV